MTAFFLEGKLLDYVIKRSGASVKYNPRKIYAAVSGANNDAGNIMAKGDMNRVVLNVHQKIYAMTASPTVEQIQDMVEDELMNAGFNSVAREYIRYRQIHELRREAGQKLMESYNDLLFTDAQDMDLKRDNANINTDASMGIMLKLGAEGAKTFVDNYVLDDETLKADKENWVHIHDKDFSLITLNCCQISLAQLLKGGYDTGHGFLREPNSIRSAASLACIAIQSNQNDMLGGQSICDWDTGLAPYVRKSFDKTYRSNVVKLMKLYTEWHKDEQSLLDKLKSADIGVDYGGCSSDKVAALITEWAKETGVDLSECPPLRRIAATAWESACADVEEETMQAMEAAIHNFNSLHSRAGGQTPFSSINFGMDTSLEGRLIIDCTLQAIWNGLGNGETPIFPISIFQLKEGVNYNPDDPNYDLFRKACRVSAKRLYPNFVSVDASFNIGIYDPKDPLTWASTMG